MVSWWSVGEDIFAFVDETVELDPFVFGEVVCSVENAEALFEASRLALVCKKCQLMSYGFDLL